MIDVGLIGIVIRTRKRRRPRPDGEWLLEPRTEVEGLFSAELDLQSVRRERQNFDPAGHYARPDVTQLVLNRERQSTLILKD